MIQNVYIGTSRLKCIFMMRSVIIKIKKYIFGNNVTIKAKLNN